MSGILNAMGLGSKDTNKDTNTSTSNHPAGYSSSSSTTTTTTAGPSTSYQTGTGYEAGGRSSGYQTNTNTSTGYSDRDRMSGDRMSGNRVGADDAMTRSEEQLHVGKESVEAGKARLHKYVTTEHVSKDVPLQKETVTLEREPITDANRDRAMAGPDIKEAEYEVNLREERPVVEKEVVAKERVRLNKNVEQSQQSVGGDIRKEHIEYGATPGVEINKTGTRTSTTHPSSTTTSRNTGTDNDLNLQGVKTTNPTYTA